MNRIKSLFNILITLSIASIIVVLINGGERLNLFGFRMSLQNLYNPILILILAFSGRILVSNKKTPKRLIFIFLIIAGTISAANVIFFQHNPFAFIMSFAVVSFVLIITLLVTLSEGISNLIFRYFFIKRKDNHSEKRLNYIKLIVLVFFALFYFFFIIISDSISNDIVPTDGKSMNAIKSLPYLTWVSAKDTKDKKNVTFYDKEKAYKGINIYNSRNQSRAKLIDMDGNTLHKWSAKIKKSETWQHIEMSDNGDLLAIVSNKMIVNMDWDSNIKWIAKKRFHHDISISENNDIYSLSQGEELVSRYGLPFPIMNNYIVILSEDGKVKKEISLFKLLKNEIPAETLLKIYPYTLTPRTLKRVFENRMKGNYLFTHINGMDIFHINTLEVIDRDIEGLCKKGNILISSRHLNLVAIVDIDKEKIIWKWGPGILSGQHHPNILKNNNILIYDNGRIRGYSRIIEINPITKKNIWEYKSKIPEDFFSDSRGADQRLPNGNTLITESDKGHVFEVTKEGDIVWEFYNPVIKKKKEQRASIYRMMRITNGDIYSYLEKSNQNR